MDKLNEADEPTLPLYLMSERKTEINSVRTTVHRLVGAVNNELINVEEGELAEKWKELKSHVRSLEQKLSSLKIEDKPVTARNGGENAPATKEKSRNDIKALLVAFKDLNDTVNTMRSVKQHFSLLIASGEYHELLLELEDTEISSDGYVPLETMRKDLIRVLSEQLKKAEKNQMRYDIEKYISAWKHMEFQRAKKREELPVEQRMNAAEDVPEDDVRRWIDEKADEMKADMRSWKRKRFIHTTLGRELHVELHRAFSACKDAANQMDDDTQQMEACINTILDYLAGSIDKPELDSEFCGYSIGYKEYEALNKCIISHVGICKAFLEYKTLVLYRLQYT